MHINAAKNMTFKSRSLLVLIILYYCIFIKIIIKIFKNDCINADFALKAVVHTQTMPWEKSPVEGVERKYLDRVGGEGCDCKHCC